MRVTLGRDEVLAALAGDAGGVHNAVCALLRKLFNAEHASFSSFEAGAAFHELLGCDTEIADLPHASRPVVDAEQLDPGEDGRAEWFVSTDDPLFSPALAALMRSGARAIMRATFVLSTARVGVVEIASRRAGAYGADDAAVLLDLCLVTRIAVDQAVQRARVAETQAMLDAQTRILASLGPCSSVSAVARAIADEARALFSASHVSVVQFTPAGPLLLGLAGDLSADEATRLSDGLDAGTAGVERKYVGDLTTSGACGGDAALAGHGLRALMRVPISWADGAALGVVTVASSRAFAFSESHLARLGDLIRAVGAVLERAILAAEAEERSTQVAALTAPLGTINASADPAEIARAFAREAVRYLGATFVEILRYETDTQTAVLIASEPPDILTRPPQDAGIDRREGDTGAPFVQFDIRDDSAPSWLGDACRSHGAVHAATIRIGSNDQAVGLIAVGTSAPGGFDAAKLQVLSDAAGPLAMLLERAHLVSSLQQHTRRTNSILGLLNAVGTQGSIGDLAHPVATTMREMFETDFCAVSVRDGHAIRVAAVVCDDPSVDGGVGLPPAEVSLPATPRLVAALPGAGDEHEPLDGALARLGYRSVLHVPVSAGDAPSCVVTLASRTEAAFSLRTAGQASHVLRPIEVAVGFFHGRREAALRERRLESTNRILGQFSRGGSPEELAQTFAAECLLLFDSSVATIFAFQPESGEAAVVASSATARFGGISPAILAADLVSSNARSVERIADVRLLGLAPQLQAAIHEYGLFSVLRAPLVVRGSVWGVAVVSGRGTGRFRREDADLLAALTGQLAVALERAFAIGDLAESELKYRSLVAQADEMIFLVDCETGAIVDANPFTAAALGYPVAELLQLRLPDLLEDPSSARADLARILAAGDVRLPDRRYRTSAGDVLDVDAVATIVSFGGRRAILVMARDISARRAMQRELVQSQKMKSLGEMAGAVAHDFNNLLTTILGFAGILKLAGYLEEDERENVALIEDAARRGADLTSRLLSFSRGGLVRFGPIDLRTIVTDTLRLADPTLHQRFEVRTALPATPVTIDGDDGQVQQALLNIVLNARDAMPGGGMLALSLEERDGCAVLTIEDNGPGMDEETRLRLFEHFYTTKPLGSGTGLGLAIAYGIVKGHKGTIALDTAPGLGARFTLTFPLATPRPAVAPVAASPEASAACVLVVDDDELVRRTARRVLVSLGYRVEEAASGEQAIELVTASPGRYSAFLLDLVMPGVSGGETLRAMRACGADAPVIVCSGYAVEPFLDSDLVADVAGVLAKPWTPDRLASVFTAVGVPPPRLTAQSVA